MSSIKKFEDLDIWQESRQLTHEIYKSFNGIKDFEFKNQIQRASLSVMNNISEGFERSSNSEFIRFLYYSKSSCGEVRSMLYIANDLIYLNDDKFQQLNLFTVQLGSRIASLIKYLKNH